MLSDEREPKGQGWIDRSWLNGVNTDLLPVYFPSPAVGDLTTSQTHALSEAHHMSHNIKSLTRVCTLSSQLTCPLQSSQDAERIRVPYAPT